MLSAYKDVMIGKACRAAGPVALSSCPICKAGVLLCLLGYSASSCVFAFCFCRCIGGDTGEIVAVTETRQAGNAEARVRNKHTLLLVCCSVECVLLSVHTVMKCKQPERSRLRVECQPQFITHTVQSADHLAEAGQHQGIQIRHERDCPCMGYGNSCMHVAPHHTCYAW